MHTQTHRVLPKHPLSCPSSLAAVVALGIPEVWAVRQSCWIVFSGARLLWCWKMRTRLRPSSSFLLFVGTPDVKANGFGLVASSKASSKIFFPSGRSVQFTDWLEASDGLNVDLCLGWIRRSWGNPACSLQAQAGALQPQLQQAGKLSGKRESFAEMCFVTLLGLGNGGREQEDRQISGLY